jgi:hypothetical protein
MKIRFVLFQTTQPALGSGDFFFQCDHA